VAVTVKVEGEARLASTLDSAASKMGDLPGIQDAAEIITTAGAAGAPRLTGRLAGSLTSSRSGKNAAQMTSPLVYAVPIHWGRPAHDIAANPFLVRAADQTETRWVGAVEKSAQDVLDRVQGA
jgi:hypothetical protein